MHLSAIKPGSNAGFSLLQISIILMVGGIILASTLPGGDSASDAEKIRITLERMRAIEQATENFMTAHQRRPYPSDLTASMDSVAYGTAIAVPLDYSSTPATHFTETISDDFNHTENSATLESGDTSDIYIGWLASGANIRDSTAGQTYVTQIASNGTDLTLNNAATATATTATYFRNPLVAGGVPTKALGLPDEYGMDGYGRRILYMVDQRATVTSRCLELQNKKRRGALAISNQNNFDAGTYDYTMWALLSYGKDGQGAMSMQGSGSLDTRIKVGNTDADTLANAFYDSSQDRDFSGVRGLVKKEPTTTFDDIVWYYTPNKNICAMGKTNSTQDFNIDGNADDPSTSSTAMGDINGDGFPDLILGISDEDKIVVLFGTKDGWPEPATAFDTANLDGTNGFIIESGGGGGGSDLTASVSPNADGASTQWSTTGTCTGGEFGCINSGTEQPTAGQTSNYLWIETEGIGGAPPPIIQEAYEQIFGMETVADVDEVTNITVWVYADIYYDSNEVADVFVDVNLTGSWAGRQNLDVPLGDQGAEAIPGWYSKSFSGSWTQEQLDNLQIQLDAETTAVQGKVIVGVYDVYAVVTYDSSDGGGGGISDGFGAHVQTGDFNNDGYTDILAGSNNGGTGYAIIFGGASWPATYTIGTTTSPTTAITISGLEASQLSYAAVGDVNGDGYTDIALPYTNTDQRLGIIYGKSSWSDFELSDANLNGTAGIYFAGTTRDSFVAFGESGIAEAALPRFALCDVNGDGYDDIIIPGLHYTLATTENSNERLFFYAGDETEDLANAATEGEIDIDGSSAVTLSFNTSGTNADAVRSVYCHDINNDGYADILVNKPISTTEYIYVEYGASSFTGDRDISSAANYDLRFNLTTSDPSWQDNTGTAYLSFGDIDNDGRDDIIMARPTDDPYISVSGSTFTINSGLTGTERPNAGIAYILYQPDDWGTEPGVGLNWHSGFTYDGTDGTAIVGIASDAIRSIATGDMNLDGKTDLLISSDVAPGGGYFMFGKESWTNATSYDLNCTRDISGGHCANQIAAE